MICKYTQEIQLPTACSFTDEADDIVRDIAIGVKSAHIVTYAPFANAKCTAGQKHPGAKIINTNRVEELQNRVLFDICTLEGESLSVEMDRGGFTVCLLQVRAESNQDANVQANFVLTYSPCRLPMITTRRTRPSTRS